MAFVPLLCQSHYSPLGVCAPAELARRARNLGLSGIGLCDEATMAGYHEFDLACREHNLRPVFGARLWLPGLVFARRRFPLNFLIENEQGYRNLVRLISEYRREPPGEDGLPPRIRLKGRTAGLLVILPPDGELACAVARRDRARTESFLARAKEIFGPRFAVGTALPVQSEHGPMLRRLAEFVRVPSLLAPPIHFAEPVDEAPFEFLRSPEGPANRTWRIAPDFLELPTLLSQEDVLSCFEENDDVVHESGEIARLCRWRPTLSRRIIPSQDFERGFDPNSYLFDLVIRGAAERYGEIDDELKERINLEFEEIKSRDLATYLLLFRQIKDFLDEHGISRGFGRGSVISSVLAYCLGITRIDPIEYDLPPEPLAAENETFPPIRVEIPSSSASELIDWLGATFGRNHLVQIGRRMELRRDQLLAEIAEWSGMTKEERKLAEREKPRGRANLGLKRLRKAAEDRKPRRWRDPLFVADLAARLSPRPRPLAPAPGRWTLSADPLDSTFPIFRLDDGSEVTDLSEAAIDSMGGPRLEFAPHHLLNILDHARHAAAESVPGLSLTDIPLDDRAAFALIQEGDTLGIPPLEGISVKCLLRKHRPSSILELLQVRTESARGRANERHRSLVDELPDVLLSYQCAYFKANYPEAYYAGALSAAAENGDNVSVLIQAIQQAGIAILPPDINLSQAHSTVHTGKIRLGLRMVRQLGQKAWEEILSVRRGSPFNSLAEFCEGVSPRTINHRLIQNLIGAGAFDDLGQSRADMSHMVSELQRRNRGAGAGDEGGAQYTLFDLSALETESRTEEESEPEEELLWDEKTTLRREREALGFNLGLGPAQRFKRIHECLRPLRASSINRRHGGKLVRICGLVDHVDAEGPLIEPAGSRLLDVEGLPVWIAPDLTPLLEPLLERGTSVLVIGEIDHADGFPLLRAEGVWRLEDIENQSRRVARVRLDLSDVEKSILRHVASVAQLFPGNSRLELSGTPRSRGFTFRLLSRRQVFFCSPLYQALLQVLPPERIQLFDHRNQLLSIAISGSADPHTPARGPREAADSLLAGVG